MITLTKNSDDSKVKEKIDGFNFCKKKREESGWDTNAIKSLKFWFGDQWNDEDKRILLESNRAPSVFNMVLPAIDLIIGHQIENRIDLVAKPVDAVADPYIADIITAGIKHIEQSNEVVYERRFQFFDGIATGIGIKEKWFDTETDFEGKIRVSQDDPFYYYLDPSFKKYNYSDARVLYRVKWLSEKDCQRIYGKDAMKDTEIIWPDRSQPLETLPQHITSRFSGTDDDYGNKSVSKYEESMFDEHTEEAGYDIKNKLLRVIEEYEKVWEEKEYYYDMENDKWIDTEELTEFENELVKDQTIKKYVSHIHLTTLIGSSIIQDEVLKATEFNQLFDFFFPYFVNGKFMGCIENLFYPQEEVNKRHSQWINILSSFTQRGIIYKEGTFDKDEIPELEYKLAQTGVAIKVNELYDDAGRKTFEIITSQGAPADFERLEISGKESTKYISGASDPMQGADRRRESGRAKLTDIQQGGIRLAGLIDNFRQTHKIEGKSYIWWMQNYYDTERVVRIMGDRPGQVDMEIAMNKEAMGMIFNDIRVGEYDVTFDFEATTQSERERWYYRLIEMANVAPMYAPVLVKEVVRLAEFPQKDRVIAELEAIQQQQMQMQQMGMPQPATQPKRGGIQSAPRPSRGPKRLPQGVMQ